MKIFLLSADADARAFNLIKPTSDKEMNITPANGELPTIIASDCARADNGDAKLRLH